MTHGRLMRLGICAAVAALAVVAAGVPTAAQGGASGTISGRVRLMGTAPANPIIRMGADPRCSRATRGQRLTQDLVLRSGDGGLANAFVHLEGKFPATPAPSQPVVINQRDCIFMPRVVGARVGQTLQISNSDPTGHNVHSLSTRNSFNTSQPKQGMVYTFQLKADEVVMRIKCDIHSWMVTYVGVTAHPYFAVSGADGAFTIGRVPAGRHTIEAWHERYGRLTRTVDVKPGATATVEFVYTGQEKPSTAGLQELIVPAGSAQLIAAR